MRDPMPETLDAGETLVLRLKVLGLPANRHTLHLESVDDEARTLHTREHGGVLRTWNHTIRIEPAGDGRCRYTDVVDIDAGRLTPVAHAVARAFFAHRQRRWHKLVEAHR